MKANWTIRCLLAAAAWGACASDFLFSADWPQWGGTENRNTVSSEQHLPATFSRDGRNLRWTARMGTHTYGNPTVADGRVFVGTDAEGAKDDPRFSQDHPGVAKCLSEATGELLWQLVVPERKHGLPVDSHFVHQDMGICSSPTAEGDRVYLMTTAAEIVCLDVHGMSNGNDGPFVDEGAYMAGHGNPPLEVTPRDADIIWRFDLMDEVGIMPHDAVSCSVLIHGDFLYTSTCNGVGGMPGETFFSKHAYVVRPDAPAIVVLDKHTGRLVARERAGISPRLWHAQWSSPSCGTVGDKTLVFFGGGDGFCYAFEALKEAPPEPVDLKLVWTYDCNPPEYRSHDGQPFAYYDGDRRKTDGHNKNDEMYVGPSEVIATPVFDQGRVYVAIGQDPAHGNGVGMLHCIDASQEGDITKTGCVWTYRDMQRTIATATVSDGIVYVPDLTGKIHGVDAKTGQRRWLYDTGAETWGGVLVADGKMFFGNERSFYIFALTAGKEPELLSKIPLGQPAYSTPIAANNTLYVASQRYLWAVSQKE
jgi:outer membrane protein assembly factor BamB